MGASLDLLKSIIPFTSYPYKGESISCTLCSCIEFSILSKFDRRWKYLSSVVCNNCGLIRTEPMPTEDELEYYYKHLYRVEYQGSLKGPPRFHITRSYREAKKRVNTLSDFLVPGADLLDFGCGSGEFLSLAKHKGCSAVGIEPGKYYADFARVHYGLKVYNKAWMEMNFPEESFDVITAHHVLEHLRDPVAAIQTMAGWLRAGGVIYLSVPNMVPNQKPSFSRFHFAHVHGFIPETLNLAAQISGLTPVLSGSSLNTTTQLFRKEISKHSKEHVLFIRDRKRAEELLKGYPDESIFSFVLGGAYFRHLKRQSQKYFWDAFSNAR